MISSKKKFKRLSLLASAYKLELEELEEMDLLFEKEFAHDFSEESIYANSQREAVDTEKLDIENIPTRSNISDGPLKKMYRHLATKHHPDKGGCEDKFKKIKDNYESGNVFEMIEEVLEEGNPPEMSSKDLDELERLIENQRKKCEEIKQTVRWAWAHSDKGPKLRRRIQESFGIDPEKFSKWKNSDKRFT